MRSRQALWHGPADLARRGSTLQRRRNCRARQPHSSWTETTAHSRAGRGSSRAGSQRTRPCRRWCGSLAPGGSGPRDQGAVQCDLGRAQRRRDAAPPRLSAAVGAAATSAEGPGGAGDTQKTLPIWSKPSSPSMGAKNRSNYGGRMKPGLVSRAHYELIFVFKVGTAQHVNTFGLGEAGRYRTNVWEYAGVNSFREGRLDDLELHPTVKRQTRRPRGRCDQGLQPARRRHPRSLRRFWDDHDRRPEVGAACPTDRI